MLPWLIAPDRALFQWGGVLSANTKAASWGHQTGERADLPGVRRAAGNVGTSLG